ncbi:uncharacterized protein [Aegilops tauschii subsp. strangulata]|uniref:uncharacterized protein isoform X2 n=1 Tax=Aegilops tauschii subsp. strangulata TaxID=200361 RepID=UPI001E1CA583|nr:uncharacterized protein LOC109762134 isoform X3 [Aegilops tauschii subsp. strangulata]
MGMNAVAAASERENTLLSFGRAADHAAVAMVEFDVQLGLSSARLASFDCTLLRSIVVTLVCSMGDAGSVCFDLPLSPASTRVSFCPSRSGCTISPVAAFTFCSLLRLCFTHQGDGSSIYKVYH